MKSADLVSMVNFGFEKVWLFEVKKIELFELFKHMI